MTDLPRLERFHTVAAARLSRVRCALETVHHRHNASAVLRTCDALGVHTVHAVGELEVSRGAARGAGRWLDLRRHEGPAEAIAALRADGVSLWIADLTDDAITPDVLPLDGPVCVWFGAETLGVCAEARAAADGVVRLPMRGFAQSLNVSVAAALVLHELSSRARALGPTALLSVDEAAACVARWRGREHANEVEAEETLARLTALGER